jgi:hypothetical protein
MNRLVKRIVESVTGGRFIETNKQLAALCQIHYAMALFRQNELECAVTLAGAAEGVIPTTNDPHMFLLLKNSPLSRKEFDYNFTINWLKHSTEPDDFIISEFEAAMIIVRAINKFFTVYKAGSPAMRSFVRWTFEQGHLPTPSLDEIPDRPTDWSPTRSLRDRIRSVFKRRSDVWRPLSRRRISQRRFR